MYKDPERAYTEELLASLSSAGVALPDALWDVAKSVGCDLTKLPDEDDIWWVDWHKWHFIHTWVMCGLPHIIVDARLSAQLMSTTITPDQCREVIIPWEAFAVTFTNDMHETNTEQTVFVSQCDVQIGDQRRSGVHYIYAQYPLPEPGAVHCVTGLWDEIGSDSIPPRRDVDYGFSSREFEELQRGVVNACAEFESHPNFGAHQSQPDIYRRNSDIPSLWTWRLSRNVKFDARAYVCDYVAGKRTSINVQYMVRGHWRNQPYGPASSLRKRIHIEAHWKGPDTAPIALRAHIMR